MVEKLRESEGFKKKGSIVLMVPLLRRKTGKRPQIWHLGSY